MHRVYDDYSDAVRDGIGREGKKAFKKYLLQVSTIEGTLDRLKGKVRRATGETDSDVGRDGRRVKWQFGFHSMVPQVAMRYEMGKNLAVKIKLGADGTAGIQFKDRRLGQTEMFAGIDSDETIHLRWRATF